MDLKTNKITNVIKPSNDTELTNLETTVLSDMGTNIAKANYNDTYDISVPNYNAKATTVLMDRVADAYNISTSNYNAKATTVLMDRVANADNTTVSFFFFFFVDKIAFGLIITSKAHSTTRQTAANSG